MANFGMKKAVLLMITGGYVGYICYERVKLSTKTENDLRQRIIKVKEGETEENLDIQGHMRIQDTKVPHVVPSQWFQHFIAGGIAGAVSRTSTAPLDRLKLYLQVHGTKRTRIKSCLKHMFREGGVSSFWRGNGINVLKIMPETALKFMTYEEMKRIIREESKKELTLAERFVAGSVAGAVSQSVIYPLEVMKTRLALGKTGEYTGIVDAMIKMYHKGGWQTFYKGFIPNLLGIIPYAGIDLAVYETIKNSYVKSQAGNQTPSVPLLLACGTVSVTCGQVCSYPLALVKTRLQAQVEAGIAGYSMVQIIKQIVQREGLVGFYRGITPNFLKVAPAVSISYVVYEKCRIFLGADMS